MKTSLTADRPWIYLTIKRVVQDRRGYIMQRRLRSHSGKTEVTDIIDKRWAKFARCRIQIQVVYNLAHNLSPQYPSISQT